MRSVRSRRVKLLEGMCRTISDRLHERVAEAARLRGRLQTAESTSAVYALAVSVAPDLLDQLFGVYRLLAGEPRAGRNGSAVVGLGEPTGDVERKRMLSAVRAAVGRSRLRDRYA